MIQNETGALLVGLKAKFFRDEPNFYIGFVPIPEGVSIPVTNKMRNDSLRFTDGRESRKAFPVHKHIHQVSSHVRRVQVKLEETMVVPKGKG